MMKCLAHVNPLKCYLLLRLLGLNHYPLSPLHLLFGKCLYKFPRYLTPFLPRCSCVDVKSWNASSPLYFSESFPVSKNHFAGYLGHQHRISECLGSNPSPTHNRSFLLTHTLVMAQGPSGSLLPRWKTWVAEVWGATQ